ncbi:regulatory protein NosR [Neisseria sp. N95_16]|uniref:4Fe-4S binding protein n=1 Tax=Neisseria brasiliensis TaxID=2666100 RepID=A0A7X2GYP5_9NEIS|nr:MULTISPECIES: NosR/NirI family protein [Neisseria]MRN37452.1 4Fe-4S binding protein [Neisseria brasiliensis]PJO08917.1 regulatory protein NosR [Neisseria sp. N95_16]
MVISLPVHAERLPEFLSKVQPSEIFPTADRYGEPEGKPMVARVYKGDEQLGLVFITTDVVNTRGYSSKPIDTMVASANDGTITGAKLVAHNEPITLIGIPQSRVDKFIDDYIGLNFITTPPKPGVAPSDIISGATVTLMVINDSMQRSIKTIAQQYQLGTAGATAAAAADGAAAAQTAVQTRPRRAVGMDKQDIQSWNALLEQKAVTKLRMTVDEANKLFEQSGKEGVVEHAEEGPGDDTFVDMYVAVVSQPSIGKSLLGEAGWNNLQRRLKPGQQAIMVAGEGRYSWKGSGYVRGGIFDRIEMIQGDNSFRFTDAQHERVVALAAEGAPAFKEVSWFTIPEDVTFDAAEPWRLQLMIQRVLSVSDKAFVTADLAYELPQGYYVDDPEAEPVTITAPIEAPAAEGRKLANQTAGILDAATDDGVSSQLWKQIWQAKKAQIIVVGIALTILLLVFLFQDWIVRYEKWYDRFRIAFLTFTLVYIGWYAQAQLSVVNTLTLFSAILTDFHWEFLLMDPLVFILWLFTAATMLLWNRGTFCGWLCPFGSLQELTNRLAKKLGVKQITVPHLLHTRLSAIKYVIFFGLLAISLYDLGLAEHFAEIEPFKTAIILKFMREWWFVLFAVALLAAGLFIERFFCRYLCPLGAAIAIPARFRIFDWLRRYKMCGNPCQICTHECPVQAIAPEGDIHPNECIQCLHCQVMYHHETRCPQVVATNKKKQRQAAAKSEHEAEQTAKTNEHVVHFVKPGAKITVEK